ncbi:hypothetical protein [Nocardia sp. CC227C]|uniref:hypothetical protein n=1 Tax=Nocardia sp. CC227C TaxID=3044562 RepID=UPI00278BDCAC|nr:hypothetical protein [Nocardia sp. CC227C]
MTPDELHSVLRSAVEPTTDSDLPTLLAEHPDTLVAEAVRTAIEGDTSLAQAVTAGLRRCERNEAVARAAAGIVEFDAEELRQLYELASIIGRLAVSHFAAAGKAEAELEAQIGLGSLQLEFSDYLSAASTFDKAIEICRPLAVTREAEFLPSLARCLQCLEMALDNIVDKADEYEDDGIEIDTSQVEARFLPLAVEIQSIYERLFELDAPQYLVRFAWATRRAADLLSADQGTAAGIELSALAVALRQQVYGSKKDQYEALSFAVESCEHVNRLLDLNRTSEAEGRLRELLDGLEALTRDNPSHLHYRKCVYLETAIKNFVEAELPAEAIGFSQRFREIYAIKAAALDDKRDYVQLAQWDWGHAELAYSLTHYEEARGAWDLYIDTYDRIRRRWPQDDPAVVASARDRVSNRMAELGDRSAAVHHARQATDAWRTLVESEGQDHLPSLLVAMTAQADREHEAGFEQSAAETLAALARLRPEVG